jgi:ribosomal protein S18 acetylase RimI-like enzyme
LNSNSIVSPPALLIPFAVMDLPPNIPVTIRPFQRGDQEACQTLYHDGLIGSTKIAENDTGFDIDDIESAYMKRPGNRFFVAVDSTGSIVGTIGVQHHEDATGEIRRLRVRQDCQRRGIGSSLLETALKFCQENLYLKVTLDTFMSAEPAMKLFEKFRFRHSRSRIVSGKELKYFYLDLYAGEAPKS